MKQHANIPTLTQPTRLAHPQRQLPRGQRPYFDGRPRRIHPFRATIETRSIGPSPDDRPHRSIGPSPDDPSHRFWYPTTTDILFAACAIAGAVIGAALLISFIIAHT